MSEESIEKGMSAIFIEEENKISAAASRKLLVKTLMNDKSLRKIGNYLYSENKLLGTGFTSKVYEGYEI
jgi:hypothetical protein